MFFSLSALSQNLLINLQILAGWTLVFTEWTTARLKWINLDF